MPTYTMRVVRVRRVEEVGFIEVEAETHEAAEEVACEMDDPEEMSVVSDEVQNHEVQFWSGPADLDEEVA